VAHAWDYQTWVENARAHLVANGQAVPEDLPVLMEDQLCQTLEPGWCNYDDPGRPRVNTDLSWGDVLGGLATFAEWLARGMRYVSQAEADRRAEICARCYLNVNIGGCAACQKMVAQVIGDRTTKYDPNIRACAVCKCVLKAKVHFPISVLDRQAKKAQPLYPEFCWLKKGGRNYARSDPGVRAAVAAE